MVIAVAKMVPPPNPKEEEIKQDTESLAKKFFSQVVDSYMEIGKVNLAKCGFNCLKFFRP